MRSMLLSVMVVALLGSTSAVAQGPVPLGQAPGKIEQVLVQVNARGRITAASPAYALTPVLTRLLHANLGEMIHTPATDKHGKPVSSQFIINVALQAQSLDTGDYAAHFAYVSTSPVPPGSWYWVHLEGNRLALASQDMFPHGGRRSAPIERYRDSYRPTTRRGNSSQPASLPSAPTMQQATHSTTNTPPPSAHSR